MESLRNRIDNLTKEQKESIKIILEFNDRKTYTYNKNGLFVNMNSLSDETIEHLNYIVNLYELGNKFIKKFELNLISF